MSFPRYPIYRATSVEWLGVVPEHWDVVPVKYLASIVNGYPFDSKLFDADGPIPLVRIRDLGQAETETSYSGPFVDQAAVTSSDVLIGMDGDFNVGRWLGEGRALLNQRMCCVRGISERVTRFLEYALPIPLRAINETTYSTTVKHLSSSQIEKIKVAVPSDVSELDRLLAFLDHETAKIDTLAAEQQRLVELLKEKRRALVSHAVTKGLNPNTLLKPSGLEWLGEVPAHWEIAPLRRFDCMVQTGPFGSQLHAEEYVAGAVPVINPVNLVGGKIIPSDEVTVPENVVDRLAHQRLRAGDIVFSRRGELGRCALVTRESEGWLCGTGCMIVRLNHVDYRARYLSFFLSLDLLRQYFESYSVGSIMDNLSTSTLLAMPLLVPPAPEQEDIAGYVERWTGEIDELTSNAECAVLLLQERRTALISAAVTGKIDVREFAHVDAEAA